MGCWWIWGTSFRGGYNFQSGHSNPAVPQLAVEGIILLKLSPEVRSLDLLQNGALWEISNRLLCAVGVVRQRLQEGQLQCDLDPTSSCPLALIPFSDW